MSFLSLFPSQRYACVPSEVIRDVRLARRHLLVLSAILLHADTAGFAWPTVTTLSEITGISPNEVSRTTTDLLKFGYLRKKQMGFNLPNKYQVSCPAYESSMLRKVSDKRLTQEQFEERLEAAKKASLERDVVVRRADGTKCTMTAQELGEAHRAAYRDGWLSVGITRSEFARHGLYLKATALD